MLTTSKSLIVCEFVCVYVCVCVCMRDVSYTCTERTLSAPMAIGLTGPRKASMCSVVTSLTLVQYAATPGQCGRVLDRVSNVRERTAALHWKQKYIQ